jgi:hypothetical protein
LNELRNKIEVELKDIIEPREIERLPKDIEEV